MLPIKLDLTEELAATLRQLRLDHPINGEVLTAENLSKAIGNNRAWMSQIESRRLKKIRREDIIAIYKILFNYEDEQDAEDKAEMDLLNHIIPNKNNMLLFGHPKEAAISEHIPNKKEINKKDLRNITNMVKFNCEEITNLFMELYFDEEDIKKKLIVAHQIQQFLKIIIEGRTDSLGLISQIPFSLYKFADDLEKEAIQVIINNLNTELEKLQYKRVLNSFNGRSEMIINALTTSNKNTVIDTKDSVVMGVLELGEILYQFPNITTSKKVDCVNIYIEVLKTYAQYNSMIFSLSELSDNSSMDDLKIALDYMQSFVNGIHGTSSYLLNHISNYFNNDNK